MRRPRLPLVLLALASLSASGAAAGDKAAPPKPPRTILVTGFGPFGGVESNPAWDSIKDLDGTTVGRSKIRTARLDVVYAKAGSQLDAAIASSKPDIVLCLGVAPDKMLRLETTARNRDTAAAPDNDGVTRKDNAIREGGPATIPTRLPLPKIEAALKAGGFEFRESDDAGGYLCNHVFYELMDRAPTGRVCGFIHVPTLGETWKLDRLKQAIKTILETLDLS